MGTSILIANLMLLQKESLHAAKVANFKPIAKHFFQRLFELIKFRLFGCFRQNDCFF